MKSLKKLAASSAVTIAALVLAVALLGYSTIGGARAALTYYSDNYISGMQLQEIGVTLLENKVPVATGTAIQVDTTIDDESRINNVPNEAKGRRTGLLQYLMLDDTDTKYDAAEFHLGVKYPEVLTVRNATDEGESAQHITQYVRVVITRYWEDEAGKKLSDLKPAFIQLWLDGSELSLKPDADPFSANGWLEDKRARTDERMVLYYTLPLDPGEETAKFADTFAISQEAAIMVVQTSDAAGTTVTRTYLYDNASFHLDIRVDAVQNHNAADAMLSAWGRTATFETNDEGDLVLTSIQ